MSVDMGTSCLAMLSETVLSSTCARLQMQLSPSCTYTAAVWRCSQINRAVLAEIPNVLSKLCVDWCSLFDLLCVGLLCNVLIWPCTQGQLFSGLMKIVPIQTILLNYINDCCVGTLPVSHRLSLPVKTRFQKKPRKQELWFVLMVYIHVCCTHTTCV